MEETNIQRTEEIQDIVDKMPVKGGYYVLIIVVSFTIMMLSFGFIIRYPQTISGIIMITMGEAPIKLVSKSSGKLKLLNHQARQKVKENEIIALIDNSTDFKDYLLVDSLLQHFSLSEEGANTMSFPNDLNLGDLNSTYYQFIDHYCQYNNYCEQNTYNLNEKNYQLELESYTYSQEHNQQQLELKKAQLEFYRREISRDSFCLTLGDYSERGVDKTRNTYLTVLNDWNTVIAEQKQIKIKIKELHNQLDRLKVEKSNYEHSLRTALRSSYNTLQATMKQWKDTYAFVTPFEGEIEFLGFWRENDFISSGTKLFSIIPKQSPVIGQLFLPARGAGKVKAGQEVNIKLNDYPYLEYGSLEGIVHSISLVTNTNPEITDKKEDLYLVLIELPNGLKTKFGSMLDFRYEVKGTAEIKVEKRRLIERLFDNLKYIMN